MSAAVMVFLATVVLAAAVVHPVWADSTGLVGRPAKYILFFIGDGMGPAQRMAAEQFNGRPLAMNRLFAQGITTTHAANRFITGSAAAATALACGQKTDIGMLGLAPDGRPVSSLAALAKQKGMKVGIISSVPLDHATPAAFYAHVRSRKQYDDIAAALASSGFDFFGGGGLIATLGKKPHARTATSDPMAWIRQNGYTVIRDKRTFMGLTPASGKIVAINPRLPDGQAIPYALDRQPDDIGLEAFTGKAIELLDNPDGFFLMVEGGKIDWACHANDAATMIHDLLAFDRAVAAGIAFAQNHADDTLIVVTGDHECGGLALGWAGTGYTTDFTRLSGQTISFQRFSDDVLPGFKANCGADCDFKAIKPVITNYFGIRFSGNGDTGAMVPSVHQIQALKVAFDRSMGRQPGGPAGPVAASAYGNYDPLTVAVTHTLNNMAGLGWTSFKHTGIAVTTSAMGVGAETFNGFYDNTAIAMKIMAAMGVAVKIHMASTATGDLLAAGR